jgi:tRNA(His) guanylyltransferase
MQDPLGDRIKSNYEDRTRHYLPRRTYTIIRLDGKAFHSYTKKLTKPFDLGLIKDLDSAVIETLSHIQGARFAYIQSDEISILLTDFEKPTSDAWYDGNVQKIASVSASILTAEFNKLRIIRNKSRVALDLNYTNHSDFPPMAYFDARVFTIPDPIEVYNYYVWRNQDCSRNSISMVAYSLYSHGALEGKNSAEKQELIYKKGIHWAEYDQSLKNGRLIVKETYNTPINDGLCVKSVQRTRWVVNPAPVFTQQPDVIKSLIPKYE